MRVAVLAFFCYCGFSGTYLALAQELTVTPLDSGRPEMLYRTSHALVIGIDGYTGGWPQLRQAGNDAIAVADSLRRQGFNVTLKTDKNGALDKRALEHLIEDFVYGPGTQVDARLFFWFAGHGHTIDGEGYLVPQDAPKPSVGPIEQRPLTEASFRRSALSLRRFGEYMKEVKARHVLAVFDSCFGGTVFEATRAGGSNDIIKSSFGKARHFLASGDADQEVSDDGLFRKIFIDAIAGQDVAADENRDGFVSATELGRYLTFKVTSYKSTFQTPRYGRLREYGLDQGEFLFKVAAPKVAEGAEGSARKDAAEAPTLPKIAFATRGSALPIYFLTDRERSKDQDRVGFSNRRNRILTLGKALVRVGKAGAGQREFSLDGMSVLEDGEFVASFPPDMARAEKFKDQAFIFIHGYNVSFDNAFYRTAQIASDIGFDGPSIVYSWPSSESAAGYLGDTEAALFASVYFADFMQWLALRTSIDRVHVISHGMGGAVLLDSLRRLNYASEQVKGKLGHMIFIAPDVDRVKFAHLFSEIRSVGLSTTLYATSGDRSLRAARLMFNRERAGEVGTEGPLILPGLDTIDVTAVSTDLFTVKNENNVILSDIALLLYEGRPPSTRLPILQTVKTPAGTYWKWPK